MVSPWAGGMCRGRQFCIRPNGLEMSRSAQVRAKAEAMADGVGFSELLGAPVHQTRGFRNSPLLSVNSSGNWLARRAPALICLKKYVCARGTRLVLCFFQFIIHHST